MKNKGFTLVELMVVIAIIAILTGILLTEFNPAKSKARDAKRVSDLNQVQLALELYYDRCKEYPATVPLNANDYNGCPPTTPQINFATYVGNIPTAPAPGSYDYATNGSSDPSDYVLHVTLENSNSVAQDGRQNISDINNFASGNTFTCDTTVNYCLGPK